ncbi:MAG TPA: hypothetical protein VHB74_00190 [Devosia sp.]|nr:hypothetical protein [Devosia sp.]
MAAEPRLEHFADDGTFPNSQLPLLIYEAAMAPDEASPEAMEALFARNGWSPQWRSSIYDFHHYHSRSHEALGIARGRATVMLGGPEGREFDIQMGDVVVIPGGVAHRRLTASEDFLVVGAYPPGQEEWDLLRGDPGDRDKAQKNLAELELPKTDPVGGAGGALMKVWREAAAG